MEAGKRNPWLTHVKKTLKAHKGKSFKAVLKMAKATYKKKGGADVSPADESGTASAPATVGGAAHLSPAAVGGRRRSRRGSKKTRRSSRK